MSYIWSCDCNRKCTEHSYRHYIIGKHTEQSSYHNAFESHYGVDGNISTIFPPTLNHEIGEWFRFDLGMSYCIKAVNLINRQHSSSVSKLISSKIQKIKRITTFSFITMVAITYTCICILIPVPCRLWFIFCSPWS